MCVVVYSWLGWGVCDDWCFEVGVVGVVCVLFLWFGDDLCLCDLKYVVGWWDYDEIWGCFGYFGWVLSRCLVCVGFYMGFYKLWCMCLYKKGWECMLLWWNCMRLDECGRGCMIWLDYGLEGWGFEFLWVYCVMSWDIENLWGFGMVGWNSSEIDCFIYLNDVLNLDIFGCILVGSFIFFEI